MVATSQRAGGEAVGTRRGSDGAADPCLRSAFHTPLLPSCTGLRQEGHCL